MAQASWPVARRQPGLLLARNDPPWRGEGKASSINKCGKYKSGKLITGNKKSTERETKTARTTAVPLPHQPFRRGVHAHQECAVGHRKRCDQRQRGASGTPERVSAVSTAGWNPALFVPGNQPLHAHIHHGRGA